MRSLPLIVLPLFALFASARTEAQQTRIEAYALESQLKSGNATELRDALRTLAAVDKATLPQQVRGALVQALLDESARHKRRYFQSKEGKALDPLPDPELITPLSIAVAEMKDPATIPAMAASLGYGSPLVKALVAFGSASIPHVAAVVMSPESTDSAVNYGLMTLRMIVERLGGPEKIDPSLLIELRHVASYHLTNRPRFIPTTWWAMDLASVLGDPTLRARLQQFTDEPKLAVEFGAIDDEVVAQTRKRATDRLRGVPPMPRP